MWEHSPYSTIIASDWLRAELSCGSVKKKNEKKTTKKNGVARLFTRFGGNLLTCGRRSLVSETQNDIVVS